jgi:hypothetical protein
VEKPVHEDRGLACNDWIIWYVKERDVKERYITYQGQRVAWFQRSSVSFRNSAYIFKKLQDFAQPAFI